MSENRDEATGQFSSGEELTGRAGIEHDAGYVQMPEEASGEPEELTVREAAEKLSQSRTSEANIVTHVAGVSMPENMTMTLEQGAKALADARAADRAQSEIDDAKRIRAEVDKLRGEDAEHDAEKPAAETKNNSDAEPDIEKVLSHPKVRDAISERVTAAETQRQAYESAIVETGKARIAALAADFPELANLPLPQWKGALEAMAQREPARFQQAISRLQAVAQVEAASQQLKQQKAAGEQAEFQKYAKAEDARFADMVKGEAPERMRAIEAEIPKMLSELGVDPLEFLKAGNESKFLRSAAAQKILVDAVKYRMIQRAQKAVASNPVPHVQRPGTRQPHVSASVHKLDALRSAFNSNPTLKNAAALNAARRAARS